MRDDLAPTKNKRRVLIFGIFSMTIMGVSLIYLQSIELDRHLKKTQLIMTQQSDTEKSKQETQVEQKKTELPSKPFSPMITPTGQAKIDRILVDIKEMKSDISSKEHYALFLALKDELQKNGRNFERLREFSIFEEPTNEAQRKQISLIYGALAQSGRIEAWPLLKEALEKGQGENIGFQAVSAVADYGALAPLEAVDSLLGVYKSHPETYIRNAAFLALGSIAQGRKDIAERVRPLISQKLNEARLSDPWYQVDVYLAAAGNHGDPQYVELVKKFITHSDDTIRGRVLFALRRAPLEQRTPQRHKEMVQWIGQKAAQDLSAQVQLEGLKSLSEQDLRLEDTNASILEFETQGALVGQAILDIAKNARSPEVLQTAIRLLSHRLTYYPEATSQLMNDLKTVIKESPEKSMIDEHLARIARLPH